MTTQNEAEAAANGPAPTTISETATVPPRTLRLIRCSDDKVVAELTAMEDAFGVPKHVRNRGTGPLSSETTWYPHDLRPVLDGTYSPPQPTVGARSDGVGLLYPGKSHSLAAEPEALKSWLALRICLTEMERENVVTYVDFEDNAMTAVGRLLTIGATPGMIGDRFRYIAPTEPLTTRERWHALLAETGESTVVVLDGVTAGMALHGLKINDNDDVATWMNQVVRPVCERGWQPAVLQVDHQVKNDDGRGRWAIGGQHKLAGLTGAAYTLERVTPAGEGMRGMSRVLIAKDRPGQLRKHAVRRGANRDHFGDLVLDTASVVPSCEVEPPGDRAEAFRPTALMAKVSDALAKAGPLGVREIQDRVQGKQEVVRLAIAMLVDEGYVTVTSGGRGAKIHTLAKPFGEPTV